jgi:hypothetical protein
LGQSRPHQIVPAQKSEDATQGVREEGRPPERTAAASKEIPTSDAPGPADQDLHIGACGQVGIKERPGGEIQDEGHADQEGEEPDQGGPGQGGLARPQM